jgi:hypothetical protein
MDADRIGDGPRKRDRSRLHAAAKTMIDAEFFGIVDAQFRSPRGRLRRRALRPPVARAGRRARLLRPPWAVRGLAERVALILFGGALILALHWNPLAVPVLVVIVANAYLWRGVTARQRAADATSPGLRERSGEFEAPFGS